MNRQQIARQTIYSNMQTTPSIYIEQLCAETTKQHPLLRNITTTIPPGCMTALMGPSGSGKSTLLSVIARDTTAVISGSITSKNSKLDHANVRYMPQHKTIWEHLTVRELLAFYGQVYNTHESEQIRDKQVEHMLTLMGLQECRYTVVGGGHLKTSLSGGERRRVELACLLFGSPSLLLLDEPTSGLSSTDAYNIMKELTLLSRERGLTIITVIHQPRQEIYELFRYLLVMSHGTCAFSGFRKNAYTTIVAPVSSHYTQNEADAIMDTVTSFTSIEMHTRAQKNLPASEPSNNQQLAEEKQNYSLYNPQVSGTRNSSRLNDFLLLWRIHLLLLPRSTTVKDQIVPLTAVTIIFVLCNWNATMTRDIINCWMCILVLVVVQAHNCIHSICYSLQNFKQDTRKQLYSPAVYFAVLVQFCVLTMASLWTLAAMIVYVFCIGIHDLQVSSVGDTVLACWLLSVCLICIFVCVACWNTNPEKTLHTISSLQSVLCILNGIIPNVNSISVKPLQILIENSCMWDFLIGRIQNTFKLFTFDEHDYIQSYTQVISQLGLTQGHMESYQRLIPTVCWIVVMLCLGFWGLRVKYCVSSPSLLSCCCFNRRKSHVKYIQSMTAILHELDELDTIQHVSRDPVNK
jgi:ABC-type multidrug transport system ATPase subunit